MITNARSQIAERNIVLAASRNCERKTMLVAWAWFPGAENSSALLS
jgi:hypothetical protein